MSRSQYNPMMLVADVVNLLGRHGVTTLVGADATTAKHAAADLLRALGVDPASGIGRDSSSLLISGTIVPEINSTTRAAPSIPSPPVPGSGEPVVGFGADRAARADERCDCGRPAQVVYETRGYGDLAWCGRAHR